MNKSIYLAFALVVIIGAVFWLTGQGLRPEVPPENMPRLTLEFPMNVVSIKDSANKLFTIDAEYPQFGNTPAAFNSDIADFVNNQITEFEKASAENWKARQDTTPAGQPKEEFPAQPFYFSSNWEPEQLNQNYVSLIVRFSEYVGGANENQNLKTFNYNFANEREVALADIFPGVPDYLQKISEIVRSSLASQLDAASQGHVATDILNQGTEPTAENFSNFVFNDNVVTFYFPKYQVAPGVFGEQYVPVLISSVK